MLVPPRFTGNSVGALFSLFFYRPDKRDAGDLHLPCAYLEYLVSGGYGRGCVGRTLLVSFYQISWRAGCHYYFRHVILYRRFIQQDAYSLGICARRRYSADNYADG